MTNLTTQTDTNETVQAGNGQDLAQPMERFATPRIAVFDTAESVILELEMPGVNRDTIDVSLERDELTVSAQRKRDDYDRVEILHQERLALNYRRSFVLGESIDGSKITARYEDGVLLLTLPKSESRKPRKIAID